MASDRSKRENHRSEESGGIVSPQAPVCEDEQGVEYDDEFFEEVGTDGEIVYTKGVEVYDSPAGGVVLCIYKWKGQCFSCDEIEWRGPYDTLDRARTANRSAACPAPSARRLSGSTRVESCDSGVSWLSSAWIRRRKRPTTA